LKLEGAHPSNDEALIRISSDQLHLIKKLIDFATIGIPLDSGDIEKSTLLREEAGEILHNSPGDSNLWYTQ
jgi:hypothetical protein